MFTIHCLVNDQSKDTAHFRAEHGVSFAIGTSHGQVLFDTGQSGEVLLHNAEQLALDLRQVDALALSHAHYDHTGGLELFLQKSRPGLPLYAHPDLFRERFTVKDGQSYSVGMRLEPSYLAQRTTLNLSADPIQILPGVWTTGEITSRSEFEGRSPHHYIQTNRKWQPDPYRDDMSLVLKGESGLIVVCGCCHAGLLNTLMQVRRTFGQKIAAIVGGTHLVHVNAETLERAIAQLSTLDAGDPPSLHLNHCTGDQPLAILKRVFGENVHPFLAGMALQFE